MAQKVYLDAQGEPIAPRKVYLDDTGNPAGDAPAATPSMKPAPTAPQWGARTTNVPTAAGAVPVPMPVRTDPGDTGTGAFVSRETSPGVHEAQFSPGNVLRAIFTNSPEAESMMRAADPGGLMSGASTVSVFSALAKPLRKSAEKGIAQALGATTNENKALAEKVVVPGLLKRGTLAASRTGLEKKAATAVEKAGQKIDEVLAAMDPAKRVDVKPIMQAMRDYRESFRVAGSSVIGNKPGFENSIAAMDGLIDLVKEQGRSVSFRSLRSLRQILDEAVAHGKGFYGKTLAEGSRLEAQRELAGAIRSELAKSAPDLAKVNAEYSFWKKAEQVVRATNQRTQSQATPLGQTIATTVGAAAGAAAGGPGGIVEGAAVGRYLTKLVQSTAWRTLSAQTKNKIADMLANGATHEADGIARVILAGKAISGMAGGGDGQ